MLLYRLKKVNNSEDLKEAGFEWLLRYCDPDEDNLYGFYYITDEEYEGVELTGDVVEVTVVVIVHNRVFHEKANAVVDKEGNLYITEDEFERII